MVSSNVYIKIQAQENFDILLFPRFLLHVVDSKGFTKLIQAVPPGDQ